LNSKALFKLKLLAERKEIIDKDRDKRGGLGVQLKNIFFYKKRFQNDNLQRKISKIIFSRSCTKKEKKQKMQNI
jgi:hypothetical protein